MVTHIGTETFVPLWCRPDDDVPIEEQRKRIKKFRAALDSAESDCTSIVHLCELWEGKGIYKHFAPTWDEFCLKWIEVQPDDIDRLCQGLQMLRAQGVDGEIPAVIALSTVQKAAAQTNGEVLPAHRPKKEVSKFDTSQSERAAQNGISRYTQIKLDRLASKHPALHALVISGELSTHAAAKAAGIVKDSAPLTILRRAWKKATPDERAAFLADIREGVTP